MSKLDYILERLQLFAKDHPVDMTNGDIKDRENAKQAILKNYRHIDDIKGAITGQEIDVEATEKYLKSLDISEDELSNRLLDTIVSADDTKDILNGVRKALNIK